MIQNNPSFGNFHELGSKIEMILWPLISVVRVPWRMRMVIYIQAEGTSHGFPHLLDLKIKILEYNNTSTSGSYGKYL